MSPTEQEAVPPSSRVLDTPTALFLLAALIFLYCFLFLPPFLPLNIYGDNLLYLAPGQRMYQGEMIYRDFFEFVTPGTALVHFFLFKLFGLRLWIPNLLSLLLGLGLVWLGVVIAKKLMRPSLALLPSAIFLVGVREFLCDPTHHWYSLLAATAAIAVLMERRTPARIAAAGFLCGLSACFTQSRGLAVAVGFGVFLWWESRRRQEGWRKLLKKEAWLAASFLVTLIAVNGYFIWEAGPARFLWCTVVFVLKYYPKQADCNTFRIFMISLPALVPLRSFLRYAIEQWLFLYAVPPLILLLFFARYWRECGKKPAELWERPMLLAVVSSFMLLSVATAPAYPRMAVSGLPALLLLGWLIDCPGKRARALAAALAVGVLLVALHAVTRRRPIPVGILATPQGKLAFTDQNSYQQYTWILQHTRPTEHFYQAGFPDPYFILNLRNPTPSPRVENNGYTTPEQVVEAIRGLKQHQVRYILWSPNTDSGLGAIPYREDPSDDHLGPLRDYIHAHYRVVKVFPSSDEVWERRG
jgi:hypothetical protein